MKRIILSLVVAVSAFATQAQNTLSAEAVAVTPGQEWTITVSLANASEFVTFQADLAVPDGVGLKESSLVPTSRLSDHTVTASTRSDGTIRVVAYNANNTSILGSDGALFTLTLTASTALTDTEAQVVFRNLRFTDASLQESLLTAFIAPLAVVTPTAIANVTLQPAPSATVYYDLQGRRVNKPQRGCLYIVGGRKVVF